MAKDREIRAGEEEPVEELQVAEYLLLLFAFDTYVAFLAEAGRELTTDSHGQTGMKLLRLVDAQQSESIQAYLLEMVTRDVSKRQIERTFRVRITSSTHASRRALSLRTVLNRGGAATIRSIFADARARKAAKATLASHMLDEPSEALSKYATISIQNVRVKTWVRRCLKMLEGVAPEEASAVSEAMAVSSPVEGAADAAASAAKELKSHQMLEDGAISAEDVQEAQRKQSEILTRVQEEATAAARDALYASGDEDTAPTRSEVIGLATAAAVAASSELGDQDNIPEPLKALDPEQRAAALTDGRVLVAAGAGSGKSHTLVRRVQYLTQDRQVNPSRILVSSFNKKAALELEYKIGKAIGAEAVGAMTVGTLHGTFRKAIIKYGTAEEKAMFQQGFVGTGSKVASAVNRVWRKCFGRVTASGDFEDAEAPSTKAMMMAKAKWAGNGVTPAQAKAQATSEEEMQAAQWYEMYLGFKGDLGPNWTPNCSNRAEAKKEWDRFLDKNRIKEFPDGRRVKIRLGDFDDMLTVFRDILVRSPEIRQRVHAAFDHVLIDECQDLNSTQAEVLSLMTEHITADGDKSYWMVGDPDQAIYSFRGAKPEQFVALDGAEGWKTRLMRTNYRCPPEVVEMANRLIANNGARMEKEANPAPGRSRGRASIVVETRADEAATAVSVAERIKDLRDNEDSDVSDHAILCRTNKELNAYETALLLKGIPYARKGASSFLGSPETKSFLGYVSLVTDSDHEQMQRALVDILNKPNRFFVAPDKVERAVEYALNNYARQGGQSKKSIHPLVALRDSKFQEDLVYVLKGTRGGFKAEKAYNQIENLVAALNELEVMAQDESATTKDIFDAVLEMPGTKFDVDPFTGRIRGEKSVTFRDELTASLQDFGAGSDDDEDREEEDSEMMGLGNISFLYALAKPDPEDAGDVELSPETPRGFWAKMARLQSKAKDLRYDIDAWEKTQADLPPEDRRPPPGVYLGTAHSTKGAQWKNVYVQMPQGRFPMAPRLKEGEDLTPEVQARIDAERESERRLAYVALTRPSENLRVLCPATYNGKPAGISEFVREAGLEVGENVREESLEGEVKTASFRSFLEDIGGVRNGC